MVASVASRIGLTLAATNPSWCSGLEKGGAVDGFEAKELILNRNDEGLFANPGARTAA